MHQDHPDARDLDMLALHIPVLKRVVTDLIVAPTAEAAGGTVVNRGAAVLEATVALVYLIDGTGRHLELVAWRWGVRGPARSWRRIPRDLGEPLPTAVRCAQSVWLPDRAAVQHACPRFAEDAVGRNVHALLAVPMRGEDEVIGGVLFGFDAASNVSGLKHTVCHAVVSLCGLTIERVRAQSIHPTTLEC